MAKQSDETKLAVMATELQYARNDITEIKDLLKTGYVSKEEHEPVKKIVYGLVGVVLIAVVGALMALVVRS